MQQRFLTDDEMKDAKAMVGWQFWAAPGMFVAVSVGFGFGALGGNPAIIFVFLLFGGVSVVLCLSAVRQYNKMAHDIERRVVEVIEGAPEHVWASRGFCYLAIAGRTIRVPNDVYGGIARVEHGENRVPPDVASRGAS